MLDMNADGKVVIQTILDTKSAKLSSQKLGTTLKSGLAKGAKVATAGLTAITTAGTATAGAMVKATKATMEYGVEVNRNSQKLNMSKKGYQEWSYVLKRSGTSIDSLKMGMKKISTAIDEAKSGSKSATENFKRLGLSVDDLKGKSQEEVFGLMVQKLQGIKDTTERSAIANKFFGRSAQEMAGLLNKSGKEVDELKKQANDLGLVMNDKAIKASADLRGSLTVLQSTFEGLRNKLGVKFLPALKQVTDGLALIAQGKSKEGLKKIEEGITAFTKKLNEMTPKILALGGTILKSLGKGLLDNLPTILNAGASIIGAILKGIAKAIPVLIKQLPKIFDALSDSLKQALGILGKELPSALKPLVSLVSGLVGIFTGLASTLTSNSTAGSLLRGVIIGLTTAYVAYKAIVGVLTIVQATLNAVMTANPIILVTTAVIALTSALIALATQESDITPYEQQINAIDRKNEALQRSIDKQRELNQAHDDSNMQVQKNIDGDVAQMEHLRLLAGELDSLVDSQGRVKAGNEAHVDFILNQLNNALGTEYKLVGNQVQQYDKLRSSIFKAIDAKTSELLLKDAEEQYTTAVKNQKTAQDSVNKALSKYNELADHNGKKIASLKNKNAELAKARKEEADKGRSANASILRNLDDQIAKNDNLIKKAKESTAKAKTDYEEKRKDASKYYGEMIRYQSAYQAAAKGNNKKAQKILSTSVKQYISLGEKITDGVASGMTDKEAMKMVESAVGTISTKTLKALKKKWNIKSPSRVAKKEIGENIGAGIALGIVDGYKDNDPTKQLSADIMTSMGSLQTSINASMDLNANIAEAVKTGFENANVEMKVGERPFARLTKEALA